MAKSTTQRKAVSTPVAPVTETTRVPLPKINTVPILSAKDARALAKAAKAGVGNVESNGDPSFSDVRAWWGNERGVWIIDLMRQGLPYSRAVKRSLRYFKAGKYE